MRRQGKQSGMSYLPFCAFTHFWFVIVNVWSTIFPKRLGTDFKSIIIVFRLVVNQEVELRHYGLICAAAIACSTVSWYYDFAVVSICSFCCFNWPFLPHYYLPSAQKGLLSHPSSSSGSILTYFTPSQRLPLSTYAVSLAWARVFLRNNLPFHILRSPDFKEAIAVTSAIGRRSRIGGDTYMIKKLLPEMKAQICAKIAKLMECSVPGQHSRCIAALLWTEPPLINIDLSCSLPGALALDGSKLSISFITYSEQGSVEFLKTGSIEISSVCVMLVCCRSTWL